jgi:hypothetical protein
MERERKCRGTSQQLELSQAANCVSDACVLVIFYHWPQAHLFILRCRAAVANFRGLFLDAAGKVKKSAYAAELWDGNLKFVAFSGVRSIAYRFPFSPRATLRLFQKSFCCLF